MFQKYLSRLYPGILSSVVVMAILWLTLAPRPLPDSEVKLFEHADKIVHALMFGGLVFALVVDRELYRQRRYEQNGEMPRRGNIIPLLLITLSSSLFGGVIELMQSSMELGRGCDPLDFLADIAGAILFAIISPRLAVLLLVKRR